MGGGKLQLDPMFESVESSDKVCRCCELSTPEWGCIADCGGTGGDDNNKPSIVGLTVPTCTGNGCC